MRKGSGEIRLVGGELLSGNQAKDNELTKYLSLDFVVLLEVLPLHELSEQLLVSLTEALHLFGQRSQRLL